MLYIFSGDVSAFYEAVKGVLGRKHRLTVIPVSPQERASARHVLDHLRQQGLHARLPGSRYYRDRRCLHKIIMNSDAIFLMGGNTFEFLAYAQEIGLFDIITEFEADGGLLLAESAGSIILSPTIATALIPTTCPDEEYIVLDDYTGMGRLAFHVSPHFDALAAVASQELKELQVLADVTECPVWVLEDGEGLLLDGDVIIDKVGQPRLLKAEKCDDRLDPIAWIPSWALPGNGVQ